MSESAKGIWAMVFACTVWGLSPIFYRALADVPPLEVLCHRSIWSVIIFAAVLALQGRLAEIGGLLRARRSFLLLAVAGVIISVNWFLFIYATQVDLVTESSLGYYIFPLVAVLFGYLFFGERLSRLQLAAVGLATLAVAILAVRLGALPWISLALAITFAAYAAIKKTIAAGPVLSVTGEILIVLPLALIWIWGAHSADWSALGAQPPGAFGTDPVTTVLLVASGAMTAGPLMLLSYATRRIALATAGVVQYLNPTLQFFCAMVLFSEPLTPAHALAFPLIWVALALYSVDSLAQERAARKRARAAATSPATER